MKISERPLAIKGVRLAAAAAGIKHAGRDDVVVIELPDQAVCAAVFTQNAFCAAPVLVARKHLSETSPRYLLINSGNANAGTGEAGHRAALESCKTLGAASFCPINCILPFSTGVIGELLDVNKITAVIPQLLSGLHEDAWEAASKAIMTTDTVAKTVSCSAEIQGRIVTVTGMAKGSGMIRPDMATMLAYLATDIDIDTDLLRQCLVDAVAPSFNSITVDGDTSTNDACVLFSSRTSAVRIAETDSDDYRIFSELVLGVCMDLARKIVLDGEGATKLLDIRIETAASEAEARAVAYTIAHSPLVKTAMFASDPNWGRILAAVGRSGVHDFDISKVVIHLGNVCIVEQGGVAAGYTEAAGQAVMNQSEILVRVSLGRGSESVRILSCDLSYDYVKINAEYRT